MTLPTERRFSFVDNIKGYKKYGSKLEIELNANELLKLKDDEKIGDVFYYTYLTDGEIVELNNIDRQKTEVRFKILKVKGSKAKIQPYIKHA
ncbi:hypothetical protein KKC13_08335 [bacterium]|nr:hypothetical protein [bacterium]MBU1959470.1 hypothetical protein [bacterium]